MSGWLKPSFELCISKFSLKTKDDSRFLKNHNVKSKMRSKNYEIIKVKVLPKGIVVKRDLEGKHTAHSFRHTSATNLAESGVSIASLCHAGRWKSCKTAEGHTEHSNLEKSDRASRLDDTNNAEGSSAKRPRLDENTTANANSKASSASPLSVVHGN